MKINAFLAVVKIAKFLIFIGARPDPLPYYIGRQANHDIRLARAQFKK